MRRGPARPGGRLAILLVCVCLAPGCTMVRGVAAYSYDRVRDTLDMIDLGVTVTPRFSLSAYACLLGLGSLGGGKVDGYFAGIGGSRVGIFRHYHANIGLILYGYEVNGWGDFDLEKPETLTRRHRGLIGWLFFPSEEECSGPT